MAVTVILDLQAKPENLADIKASLKQILPDTRAYDGCIGVEVGGNQDDPNNVMLIERWESRQHYEKYLGWRQETGFIDKLGAMISAAPSIRYFDAVEA